MSDTKYLTDGRKVVIVGKLNNTETIVQEVFVTQDGDEVPSGERFVVKSLHDTPVQSWKNKEAKKIDERIESAKRELEAAQRKTREVKGKLKAYQAMLASTSKFVDLLSENELEIFTMFITGTAEYLVTDTYEIREPIPVIDKIIQWSDGWGERRYESIKLLSVMGASEGNLEYRIHQYRDGSGGWDICYPCKNREQALNKIKEFAIRDIEKNRLNENSYKKCLEMGIQFSQEHSDKYESHRQDVLHKNLKTKTEQREKLEQEISAIQNEIED